MKFLRELGQNRQNRKFEKPLSLGKIGQKRLKPDFPVPVHEPHHLEGSPPSTLFKTIPLKKTL